MTRQDQTLIRGRLVVRYVAKQLGGVLLETKHQFPDIQIAPNVGISPATTDGRLAWRAVYLSGAGRQTNSSIRVTTAVTRSVRDTVRDLQRRLIPAAKEWAAAEYRREAARLEERRVVGGRIDELAQILGKPSRVESGYRVIWDGLTVHEFSLSGESCRGFVGSVEVHSWHCLLLIARLIAEDHRAARWSAAQTVPAKL